MNLADKVKKVTIPLVTTAMLVGGTAIGIKGDIIKYKYVSQLSPKIERSFITGEVTNQSELDCETKDRIEQLYQSAANHYQIAIPIIIGGLASYVLARRKDGMT